MTQKADIALIGLAVMGKNLILNMADNGITVTAYNRTVQKVTDFKNKEAKGYDNIIGATSIEEMIATLESPRKVMLMVQAGAAVDATIEQLLPHLAEGDIIIDGGNSQYSDTERRISYLAGKGIHYVGSGISGGEEGARRGPSIMPGGDKSAWSSIEPIFTKISAKAGPNSDEACCQWLGEGGSGHFVKMVHNGIEYGDMQLIAETYDIIKQLTNLDNDEMSDLFAEWNEGELESYLIEITADILKFREGDGEFLVDKILDVAGQKGTGRWTSISALSYGSPLSLITESVYARSLSGRVEEREEAAKLFAKPKYSAVNAKELLSDLEKALYAAKIISYAQGFTLFGDAAKEHGWKLDYATISRIWRGGCIIRSRFLDRIAAAYEENPSLANLIFAPFFADALREGSAAMRRVIAAAISNGIPTPTFSAALSYFDTLRQKELPASLVQAQRDYFGAHTYERRDSERGEFFHTDWTEA